MNTRIAAPLMALAALSGLVGLASSCGKSKDGPSILVRYAEPPARGDGRLALASCLVTVQNESGVVLVAHEVPASKDGGQVRKVRLPMSAGQIGDAARVTATCKDAAGRTGGQATHSLPDKPEGVQYTNLKHKQTEASR